MSVRLWAVSSAGLDIDNLVRSELHHSLSFSSPPKLLLLPLPLLFVSLPMERRFWWAAWEGEVNEVKEILLSNPDLDVNVRSAEEDGSTALLAAWINGHGSIALILLAHPRTDVNLKNAFGETPFLWACRNGRTSCARLLLKDSRVKVNEPTNDGCTPLWRAAARGRLSIIKWWIASGREMDLGKPGNGRRMPLWWQRRRERQK